MADVDGYPAYACWYPQMGGYVGRCVVVITPDGNGDEGVTDRCFEAYVWHDGDFPFNNDMGSPNHIHHCMPSQFQGFAEFVLDKQEQHP
jgi:hypothetical protein